MATRVEVIGVKEVLKDLRQLDPEMRKQFNKDAKDIVAPLTNDAKGNYPAKYLSGMFGNWTQNARKLFPYDQGAARKGVVLKVDTGKRNSSVFTVIQKNPAAAIIDIAGKRSSSVFVNNLTAFGQPSRVMWPAAERNQDQVQKNLLEALDKVAKEIERNIVRI